MIAIFLLGLITIYLIVAALVTWGVVHFVGRQTGKSRPKRIAGVASILVFILIPTWDVILGRIYFNYLCATEGGVEVYETVELGPQYYGEDGVPRYITKRGVFDEAVLDNRFKLVTRFEESYGSLFRITLDKDVIVNTTTNEKLGSKTSFIYFGGWLFNSFSGHASGNRCYGYNGIDFRHFLKQIFRRAN